MRFTIDAPGNAPSAAVRRPRYVGPTTQSMRISISGTSSSVQVVNLTPTSGGCASTLASTQCTLTLSLTPGSYTAAITTYNGANATGTLLSEAQNVAFTIVAGTTNSVALTLSGIPHRILVVSGSPAVTGNAAAGFQVAGTVAGSFVVEALDADNNIIVGPGSPTYSVALLSGAGYATANPSASSPNLFTVTPPGTDGAFAWVKVTATYSDNSCGQVGASCTTAFMVRNHLQQLFIASLSNSIAMIKAPYTGTPSSVTNGVNAPSGLVLDASQNLFVINGNQIAEYAPPYTGTPNYFGSTVSVSVPGQLAIDAAGDLFLDNASPTNNVVVFSPPYTAPPATVTTDISNPVALVADPPGDFFVANSGGNVYEFTPPYTGLPGIITSGVSGPSALALNTSGTLFIANRGTNTVTTYNAPYSGTSHLTLSPGINSPNALAFDSAQDLFVANGGNNTVTVYAPPYVSVLQTITTGISSPTALTTDANGNLFVLNGNAAVLEYAPPYTGTPTNVSSAVTSPSAIVVSP